MDILQMLRDLYAERSQLEGAILTLERLASGQPKRRGRPPKWMSHAQDGQSSLADVRKKRVVSPEARERMAAGQRKRWAAVRKAEVQA